MNDSSVSPARQAPPPWLLLIHLIPPKPDYFRVKVRRRLSHLGAVPLKNSVYILPNNPEALEDFEWLRREIVADGGEAMVCEAAFVAGIEDQEITARWEQQAMGGMAEEAEPAPRAPDRVTPGQTWVTRQNVFVDRIASAWLIRRFIDPDARFKFVPAKGYRPEPGELRFDMFDAEYSHEGERCTFETLVSRFRVRDRALSAIAEIVHDIDCKDDKYERPEAAGLSALLRSITLAHPDDDSARLAAGAELLDGLYRHFQSAKR